MRHILNHLVGANLCVRPMNGSYRYSVAQYIFQTTAILLFMAIFIGCEEARRFEIVSDDSMPPGQPVFVDSKPLAGGARIFFQPPADEDLLFVEASYISTVGKELRFSASYFTDSLDVYGFDKEGEHIIELCAVDRAGNRSASIPAMVESLEPAAVSVAKSVEVLSSFSSMMLKWINVSSDPLYVWVDLSYTQNGIRREHTTVFNTHQSETRSVDSLNLYANEQVTVKVSVRDKYDNVAQAKDTAIVLLTDEAIDKDAWTLPASGTRIGSIMQVNGLRLEASIDGIVDIDLENYFITSQTNPWNLIIDLGDEYELSRIVTHQRWTGYITTFGVEDYRGNLYRGNNVLTYDLYGWDETQQTWDFFSRRMITQPVVITDSEYTMLGKAGDMAFLYPEEPKFSKPTRWFRLEAVNGTYISEITLYGRKAR